MSKRFEHFTKEDTQMANKHVSGGQGTGLEEETITKEYRKRVSMTETFPITVVMVSWVYTCVKTDQVMDFKYIQHVILQLYLRKVVKYHCYIHISVVLYRNITISKK